MVYSWVQATRDARYPARADSVRAAVLRGEISLEEGERRFAKIQEEIEQLRDTFWYLTRPDRAWAEEHLGLIEASVEWKNYSMHYHVTGGMEATLDEDWARERKAMLEAMLGAIPQGITRISKTSGTPVFTEVCPASRLNPEGVALSWKPEVARRQMVAAGLA